MSVAVNYPIFVEDMKALFKNRDLNENQWAEALCGIIQDHILSAGVNTTVTGTAGTTPVTGAGIGGLS